jgi:hypothetical protein
MSSRYHGVLSDTEKALITAAPNSIGDGIEVGETLGCIRGSNNIHQFAE